MLPAAAPNPALCLQGTPGWSWCVLPCGGEPPHPVFKNRLQNLLWKGHVWPLLLVVTAHISVDTNGQVGRQWGVRSAWVPIWSLPFASS